MNLPERCRIGFGFLLLAILAGIGPSLRAQTLYDASLGTLPDNQGWSYAAVVFTGSVNKTLSENSALLDTTSSSSISAGWSPIAAPTLDRAAGFALAFTARVNAEAHANANRAGFSVIVLGSDTNGVELGYWTTNIFAQSDSPLFTHAEDTAFVTTNGFVNYALAIFGTNYVLHANGTPILAGAVRNYTAFNGPINPYRTPNFIFIGDDTTSASGSFQVRSVAVIKPPLLTSTAPGVITWSGVTNVAYSVQASANLTTWTNVGTVTSATRTFTFTNNPSPAANFLRVAFP